MDAPHFDALARRLTIGLSRRGFGLLAILGLRRLAAPDPAAAKKKKKRCPPCKRRKKGKCKGALPDGAPCPGGSCRGGSCRGGCLPRDQCCTADDCPPGVLCCDGVCSDDLRAAGVNCNFKHDVCCSNYCQPVFISQTACAAMCRGKECERDSDCCRGFPCREVAGSAYRYCGGCQEVGDLCETDADCCFSACTTLLGTSVTSCMSFPGGPCAKNADCRSCIQGQDCTVTVNGAPREICHNGVCGCPDDYECCSNFDCDFDETCVFVIEASGLNGECRPVLPG